MNRSDQARDPAARAEAAQRPAAAALARRAPGAARARAARGARGGGGARPRARGRRRRAGPAGRRRPTRARSARAGRRARPPRSSRPRGRGNADRAWSSGSSAGNGSVTRGDVRPSREGAPVTGPGGLVVVGTPIGNLDDLSPRAAAWLRDADLVACEDTRRTATLLRHAGADTRMMAVHQHNEAARARPSWWRAWARGRRSPSSATPACRWSAIRARGWCGRRSTPGCRSPWCPGRAPSPPRSRSRGSRATRASRSSASSPARGAERRAVDGAHRRARRARGLLREPPAPAGAAGRARRGVARAARWRSAGS